MALKVLRLELWVKITQDKSVRKIARGMQGQFKNQLSSSGKGESGITAVHRIKSWDQSQWQADVVLDRVQTFKVQIEEGREVALKHKLGNA